jgi:outer membrane protein assembly factor BamE (lipoprotein component of BamABCDE complex)
MTFICLMSLTACQSTRYKDFQSIREGWGKDEVLEAAGPPNRSKRFNGKDRWIYVFKNKNSVSTVREVHFSAGHVVYVGAAVEPEQTAEEADRQNELANVADAKKRQEDLQKHRQAIEEMYDAPVDVEKEKRKRAPEFEPL